MDHLVQTRHAGTETLLARINTLNPWYYPVPINGVLVTPGIGSTSHTPPLRLSQRTLYRKHLIVNEVAHRVEISGARVFDIACNMGYWSWQYAKLGARRIKGVEGRKLFVDQAEFFWKHNGMKCQHHFMLGDVLDEHVWNSAAHPYEYDICLCCGLLYHLRDYRAFLSRLVETLGNTTLVIDTRVTTKREQEHHEPYGIYFNSLDGAAKTAVTPNVALLLKHLKHLGYSTEVLQPQFLMPEATKAVDNYVRGNRVTILCRKPK